MPQLIITLKFKTAAGYTARRLFLSWVRPWLVSWKVKPLIYSRLKCASWRYWKITAYGMFAMEQSASLCEILGIAGSIFK